MAEDLLPRAAKVAFVSALLDQALAAWNARPDPPCGCGVCRHTRDTEGVAERHATDDTKDWPCRTCGRAYANTDQWCAITCKRCWW